MVLHSGYKGIVILGFIVHFMVSGVISSHFRGGIFMIRPVPGSTQKEVSLI